MRSLGKAEVVGSIPITSSKEREETMAQCNSIGCTREGTVERHIDAPFTMTSQAAQSLHRILECQVCHDQYLRMKEVGKPATLGKL